MFSDTAFLHGLSRGLPQPFDIVDDAHLEAVRMAAEAIEATGETAAELLAREAAIVQAGDDLSLAARLALKLAASRTAVRELIEPVHLSIVFAVYKEHTRILTRGEHPQGEDFLRRKLAQLRWLFDGSPQHSWDLAAVDDGCPEGSGRIAQSLLETEGVAPETARVLFLDDAITRGDPVVAQLASTDDSRKGGSIRFGLWEAARAGRGPNHVVAFTDADCSTHLGQTGLLLEPIVRGGANAAVGSRREPASVVVKKGVRNTRGKLFIYLWKRLIPQLRGVTDTQCGFKAFRASNLLTWIEDTAENGFAFDIEFLIRVHLSAPGTISRVPVAWIDSEGASTTTEFSPYLGMLRSVVGFYRRYLPADAQADAFAAFIEELDEEAFRQLVENVPPGIADREPLEFDEFSDVTVEMLRAASK